MKSSSYFRACFIFPLYALSCGIGGAASTGAIAPMMPAITPERPGLSMLLPAQSFAVAPDALGSPEQELALDPLDEDPLASQTPESEADLVQLNWQPGVDWTPSMAYGGSARVMRTSYRLGVGHPAQGWIPASGYYSYVQDNGSTVSLGQVAQTRRFWGDSPRLGGVQVTQLPSVSSRGTLMPGALGWSTAFGRTSSEDLTRVGSGGLSMGLPMVESAMRYGLTSDLTLETHVQSGLDSSAKGLGGTYAMGDWGAVHVKTTQTQDTQMQTQTQGTGLGIQFKRDQQQFESTYTSTHTGSTSLEQKLGFKHTWLIAPQTRVQLGGDRELGSGNYSMRMELSVPLESLAVPWWRF